MAKFLVCENVQSSGNCKYDSQVIVPLICRFTNVSDFFRTDLCGVGSIQNIDFVATLKDFTTF